MSDESFHIGPQAFLTTKPSRWTIGVIWNGSYKGIIIMNQFHMTQGRFAVKDITDSVSSSFFSDDEDESLELIAKEEILLETEVAFWFIWLRQRQPHPVGHTSWVLNHDTICMLCPPWAQVGQKVDRPVGTVKEGREIFRLGRRLMLRVISSFCYYNTNDILDATLDFNKNEFRCCTFNRQSANGAG